MAGSGYQNYVYKSFKSDDNVNCSIESNFVKSKINGVVITGCPPIPHASVACRSIIFKTSAPQTFDILFLVKAKGGNTIN
jgi:hypothetical protein